MSLVFHTHVQPICIKIIEKHPKIKLSKSEILTVSDGLFFVENETKTKVLELLYRAGPPRDFLFRFVFYAVESVCHRYGRMLKIR